MCMVLLLNGSSRNIEEWQHKMEEEKVWQDELKRKRDNVLKNRFSSREDKIEELSRLLLDNDNLNNEKLDKLLEKARLWSKMQKKQKSDSKEFGANDELYEDESEVEIYDENDFVDN